MACNNTVNFNIRTTQLYITHSHSSSKDSSLLSIDKMKALETKFLKKFGREGFLAFLPEAIKTGQKLKAFHIKTKELFKQENVESLKVDWLKDHINIQEMMANCYDLFCLGVNGKIKEKYISEKIIIENNVKVLTNELVEKISQVGSGVLPLSNKAWVIQVSQKLNYPKDFLLSSIVNDIEHNKKIFDLLNQIKNSKSNDDPQLLIERTQQISDIYNHADSDQTEYTAYEKKLMNQLKEEVKVVLDTVIIEMATLLKVSEKLTKPITEISQEDIAVYDQLILEEKSAKADKCMEELLAADAIEKEQKKPSITRKRNNNRSKNNNASKSQNPSSKKLNSNSPLIKSTPAQKSSKVEFLTGLYKKVNSSKELDRVTKRWKTHDPDTIREFEDIDANDNVVKRYRNLNDEEIFAKRARHYLPGVEVLLSDNYTRSVYTFPTNRGFGMFAELSIEGNKQLGIIYFGVNANKVIYHKYFTSLNEATPHARQLLSDPDTDVTSFLGGTHISNSNENGSNGWKNELPFEIETNANGVIHFQFTDEKHSVDILPICKNLMRNEFHQ